MYTTKESHKWQRVGFLSSTVGYMDKVTLDRKTLDRRFKGCQFKSNPPKSGREGYFSRWSYESAPPVSDASRRRKMRKETGFGSSAVADRGEFGNQSRQFEWAERIKSEKKASFSRSKSVPNGIKKSQTLRKKKEKPRTKRYQYDVAHDTSGLKGRRRPKTADPRQSSYVFTQAVQSSKKPRKSKHAKKCLMMHDFYTYNRHLSTPHPVHNQGNSRSMS